MSDVVIQVEELGKQYRIGTARPPYETLRDSLVQWIGQAFPRYLKRRILKTGDNVGKDERIWALRDVSFEVRQGQVLGIIGRNGAGKSTLLKILSRVTAPTRGKVILRGRVGSLLEVGTGFHPELSGRENIYLNGAILGMRRSEITNHFDNIVAFAEVEKFIDTPLKRYSTGMYMRLAFSVAAHLDTEILLVDEVLAVGDLEFQKKCLGKMGQIVKQGRTIIFVSHNLTALSNITSKCILLESGILIEYGETSKIIETYIKRGLVEVDSEVDLSSHHNRRPNSVKLMKKLRFYSNREISNRISMGEELVMEIIFSGDVMLKPPILGFVISNALGNNVFGSNNRVHRNMSSNPSARMGKMSIRIPCLPLMPGRYYVSFWLGDHCYDYDIIENAGCIEVIESDVAGSGVLPPRFAGDVFCPAEWNFIGE